MPHEAINVQLVSLSNRSHIAPGSMFAVCMCFLSLHQLCAVTNQGLQMLMAAIQITFSLLDDTKWPGLQLILVFMLEISMWAFLNSPSL